MKGRAVAAAGLLALSARAGAQTLPLPRVPVEIAAPPEETSSTGGTEGGVQPAGDVIDAAPPRPAPWEFALGAGLGWDSNIDFRVPDGPSDFAFVPRAGIARVFRRPHGHWKASASGLWTGYHDRKDLRRYYADVLLDGSFTSSPRSNWQASASYGLGDTASAEILREQGVALPRVKTQSLAATLGGSRRVGLRTSLRIDGRVNGTDFDSPDLVDGASARVTAGLDREMGERTTAGIGYAAEQVFSDHAQGSSYLTHFASASWTRIVSRRTALLLEGGASFTPDAARAGLARRESFFGGASFTGELEHASLTLFVRREVAPAFGTGTSRLDLRAGLRAAVTMGTAWELELDGNHVIPQQTAAAAAQGQTNDGFARLSRRLGGSFEVSAEGRYRRVGEAFLTPAMEELQAGLFFSLR